MNTAAPARIYFNTDTLPQRDRFPAFCEEMFRHIIGADIVQLGPTPFRGVLDVRSAGAVNIADISLTPANIMRRADHISDGNDAMVVQLWQTGAAGAAQGKHSNRVESGEGLVIDNARAARVSTLATSRFFALTIPRGDLVKRGRITALRLSDNAAVRLLAGYLQETLSESLADGRFSDLFANQLVDLAALAVGVEGDARSEAEERGGRVARRSAILRAIATRSGDPRLNAVAIAALLGVTPRYVHILLEETGKSFTHHLLERRLENAAALLRDPRWWERRIADVAIEAGFSDLSYFSRAFRRRYGATPSDVREAAHHEPGRNE
jgi:AraC-like DNA-binding protein